MLTNTAAIAYRIYIEDFCPDSERKKLNKWYAKFWLPDITAIFMPIYKKKFIPDDYNISNLFILLLPQFKDTKVSGRFERTDKL